MITHLIALLIGFIAGLLVYRKHSEKLLEAERKAKSAVDALK